MAPRSHRRVRERRGHAAVEVALMMPWIFFLFVAGTVILWLIVWRLGRSDERFHKQVVRKMAGEPETSLNELGLEDTGPPKFD